MGLLVLDDTTLDKPYARNMGLVTYHWSGKGERVVRGINPQTLLWTDGKALIPCDFRVVAYAQDGKGKNDHLLEQCLRRLMGGAFSQGLCCLIVGMLSFKELEEDPRSRLALAFEAEV
jgi:hypothetical protein